MRYHSFFNGLDGLVGHGSVLKTAVNCCRSKGVASNWVNESLSMPQTVLERPPALLTTTGHDSQDQPPLGEPRERKGFGGKGREAKGSARKGGSKRGAGLSKGDWGPLGKHPDLEAIVARQRLHLPLSGRLSVALVNQAWKRCAAEHHPDRGGEHDTMQLVNGARDLLLGRDLH